MRIGISLGDPTGIGPEVTLKAVAAELEKSGDHFTLFGSSGLIAQQNAQFNTGFSFDKPDARVSLVDINEADPARAAIASLRSGAESCLRGELDAFVTAPVNKEAIQKTGIPFVGQTEFLAELSHCDRYAMMLLGCDDRERWLRVVLVTRHLPLRQVPDSIDDASVQLAIEMAHRACVELGLQQKRIAVCGLNPHAGEGGRFGMEEDSVIAPAIAASARKGIQVAGPFAADSLFHQAYHGRFDVVVAMYHDQGLAPLKTIGFDRGVNWSVGLPFIRTSPDHGTAHDIAGKGVANPESMCAAIGLARQLAQAKSRGSK